MNDKIIDLSARRAGRIDAASAAKLQIVAARQSAGQDYSNFARSLSELLAWDVSPELVETWESKVVPPGDVLVAAQLIGDTDALADVPTIDLDESLAGVHTAYQSRTEMLRQIPVTDMLESASLVEASGLSLNVICQNYPSKHLARRVEDGATFELLFLRPGGQAIAMREQEEGFNIGALTALTQVNIDTIRQRTRNPLPEDAKERLRIGTYDETIRFNLMFIDNAVCFFQPYLHGERGLDNPTFIIRPADNGIYESLRRSYDWIREQATYDD